MARTVEQYSRFETKLYQILGGLTPEKDVVSYAATLVVCSDELVEAIVEVAREASKTIDADPKGTDDEAQLAYVLIYEWLDAAKNYLLLWRDTIFALHNGRVKEIEGRVPEGSCRDLLTHSHNHLNAAAAEWIELALAKKRSFEEGKSREIKRQLGTWRLQKNPLPVYEEQFEKVPEQCECIQEKHLDLYPVAHQFMETRNFLLELTGRCWDHCLDVGRVVEEADRVCRELLKNDPEKNIGRVAVKLEDFDQDLDFQATFPDLEEQVQNQLRNLPEKISVPIGLELGSVLLNAIAFRRKARQWLESEILPLLFQVATNLESGRNEARMTLLNLRNWSLLLAREQKEGKGRPVHPEEFSQLPNELRERLKNISESIRKLIDTIERRLHREFFLSAIYRTHQEFLPLATQSTLKQLSGTENSIVNQTGQALNKGLDQSLTFLQRQVRRFRNFLRLVEEEETLSDSEKIVRFLEDRQSDTRNGQYESIFRAQGFISTSFIVGRESEMAHAAKVLESWENGYRGSLLLTGKRFSGKTLFGERFAEKYFDHHTIRLEPNSSFTVQGRKYDTGYDLGHALELIRKYTLNYRTLIWIDDFEHWWSPDHSYYENGLAVKDFLEHQTGQTFLMVSMGNALRPRLSKLVDWDRLFQAHINLDHMPTSEVHEAIQIRHNATHQRLVNEQGNDVTVKEFRRYTRAVYQAAGGNIGEALAEWAFASRRRGDHAVENVFQYGHSLPDFLDEDLAILLASIMMQRRSNEFRLRQFFGPAFNQKYSLLVRRMLNVGVLERGADDWLEINPILANELGMLLERDGYIRYSG